MGRRLKYLGLSGTELQSKIVKTSIFSALVMSLICIASAYFATKDINDTALNLKGMFKLPFLPTSQMIIAVIIFGGAGLTTLQYLLTKKCIIWASK